MSEVHERPEPREIRIVEDRIASLRHVLEAIAILAAGIWAFYVFIYQEKIKPANQPAALSDRIEIHRLGRNAGRDILSVKIDVHNTGQTEIDIAADGYDLWGERFAKRETTQTLVTPARRTYERELRVSSKKLVSAFMELRDMAVGGSPGNHIVLEPGETDDFEDVVALPGNAYDLLYARVIAIPLKTTQTRKLPITIVKQRDGALWLAIKEADGTEYDNESSFAL